MKRILVLQSEGTIKEGRKLSSLFLLFFLLLSSISSAADDQTQKAVRRSSPETGSSAGYQKRVALVIGNSDYKVGPLMNPAHDAEDISTVLKTLGFDVQTKINVNQREMEEALNTFVQQIQGGDVALFYFSGHGAQVRGENYLIPLGDPIESETDVRYKTLNAGLVLGKMEESRNRANIVILDACRNNPFKGLFRSPSMGLTKMEAPKGTFIAYATSPDSVAADGTGRNSPYTKHLIEALRMKDIPIEQAFKLVARAVNRETGGQQTPWISSSLLDDFYCNPSSASPQQELVLPTPEPPKPSSPPDYKEMARFTRIMDTVKKNFVREVTDKSLVEGAISGMLSARRLDASILPKEMASSADGPPTPASSPDYRELARFREVADYIYSNHGGGAGFNKLIDDAVSGMLKSLDPHSSFLDEQTYKNLQVETKGEFAGVGIEIRVENGELTVVQPIAGSPADVAGLLPADKILKIDGETTKDISLSKATQLLRGPKGSGVTITIMREGLQGLKDYRIYRDTVRTQSY